MDEQNIKYDRKPANSKAGLYGTLSLFVLVLTVILVYSVFWGPAKKFGDSLMPARVITVTAEGKATMTPDIAKFTFLVVTQGSNPQAVALSNNQQMNSAITYVKSNGIEDKDVKTIRYDLSPRYSYERSTGKSYIYGYELTQTVSVKVRDFNKVGKIIGGLPKYGINNISSVSFSVEDPEKYLAEARDKAFDKAKSKASEMAGRTGVQLGNILNFSESSSQPGPPPYYSEVLGKGGATAVAPLIQPGSQETSVVVSVTYEIK